MTDKRNVKSLKIAIFPSKQQEKELENFKYLYKHAYNWYLERKKDYYKLTGNSYNWQGASYDVTILKSENKCPWFLERLPVEIWKEAFKTVDKAFVNMYEGRAGYPNFKKKHTNLKLGFDFSKCRFSGIENQKVSERVKGDRPRLYLNLTGIGRVQLHLEQTLKYLKLYTPEMRKHYTLVGLRDMALEILKEKHKVNLKVSHDGKFWFISFGIEYEVNTFLDLKGSLGMDVGLKETVAYSKLDTREEGFIANINKERSLKILQRRLINKQREAAKFYPKDKDKRRRYKKHETLKRLEYEIKMIYRRMNNIRKEKVYGIVAKLLELKPEVVVVETLKIKNLMFNSKLSASFQRQALGNLLRVIEYECYFMGVVFRKASQWYASSKLCSSCGNKKLDLKLSDRKYVCSNCGEIIDRDINAARNLSSLGYLVDGKLVRTKIYGEKVGKKVKNENKVV